MQYATQLLRLPVGLDRHAAEDDLLAIVVAGLRDEHLEGPHLVAAHRAHVTGVDGKRDRLRRRRRHRRWQRDCLILQPGADLQGPLLDGIYCRQIADREEVLQQGAGAAVRQPSAELGKHALILRRAAVGDDLGHRRDGRAHGDAASTGPEARGSDLDHTEQRPQLPRTPVLHRPLSPTVRAAPPGLAVLLGLRLNETPLQAGKDRLGLPERQSQRRRRTARHGAVAGMHLMHPNGADCAGQLQHDPPLHPALPFL